MLNKFYNDHLYEVDGIMPTVCIKYKDHSQIMMYLSTNWSLFCVDVNFCYESFTGGCLEDGYENAWSWEGMWNPYSTIKTLKSAVNKVIEVLSQEVDLEKDIEDILEWD